MNVGIVVFARMSSDRLPNKMLMPVGREKTPLLSCVVDRLAHLRQLGLDLVVATSSDVSDDPLEEWCSKHGWPCFRGSLVDVLSRAIECADRFEFDYIVRVCGDRPFVNSHLIAQFCEIVTQRPGCDLITNFHHTHILKGQTCELVFVEAMRKIRAFTDDSRHREHITSCIYENRSSFSIFTIMDCRFPGGANQCLSKYGSYDFAVDTKDDLMRTAKIVNDLGYSVQLGRIVQAITNSES